MILENQPLNIEELNLIERIEHSLDVQNNATNKGLVDSLKQETEKILGN